MMINGRGEATLIRKRTFSVLTIAVMILSLTGCAGNQGKEKAYTDMKGLSSATQKQEKTSMEQDGKKLLFDADVSIPDTEKIYRVTLGPDEDKARRLGKKLMEDKYRNIARLSEWDLVATKTESADSETLADFALDDEWAVNYTDVVHDVSYGDYHGEDQYGKDAFLFRYGYTTDIIPNGMQMRPEEAGESVCSFFKDYTGFTFAPYRILAADSTEDGAKSGYYTVWLRAVYENFPVCIKSDSVPLGLNASISENGIVDFQGLFLLKKTGQDEVTKIVTLQSVMDRLKASFSQLSNSVEIRISHIALEYVSERQKGKSYLLRPVWAFYGTAAPEGGTGRDEDWVYLYSAEDGTLYDYGDLYSSRGGMQQAAGTSAAAKP